MGARPAHNTRPNRHRIIVKTDMNIGDGRQLKLCVAIHARVLFKEQTCFLTRVQTERKSSHHSVPTDDAVRVCEWIAERVYAAVVVVVVHTCGSRRMCDAITAIGNDLHCWRIIHTKYPPLAKCGTWFM